MMLHLNPTILSKFIYNTVSLIDVCIPQIDVTLRADKDLKVCKPFANKHYHVACRKAGRKAYNGFFIETDKPLTEFSVITRWSLNAEHVLVHDVRCKVLDNDFDAVSLSPLTWVGFADRKFKSRMPAHLSSLSPLDISPKMEVCESGDSRMRDKVVCHDDYLEGLLIRRTEQINIHTIERERLASEDFTGLVQLAPLGDAFIYTTINPSNKQ